MGYPFSLKLPLLFALYDFDLHLLNLFDCWHLVDHVHTCSQLMRTVKSTIAARSTEFDFSNRLGYLTELTGRPGIRFHYLLETISSL